MGARRLWGLILADDALTRRLGDAEARVLVEWLVEQAEQLEQALAPAEAERQVGRLRRRGRGIARFVSLWCLERARGPAAQLAAAEGFTWPLPAGPADPCELMQAIVAWESCQAETGRAGRRAA
jgi:hypothetical protein